MEFEGISRCFLWNQEPVKIRFQVIDKPRPEKLNSGIFAVLNPCYDKNGNNVFGSVDEWLQIKTILQNQAFPEGNIVYARTCVEKGENRFVSITPPSDKPVYICVKTINDIQVGANGYITYIYPDLRMKDGYPTWENTDQEYDNQKEYTLTCYTCVYPKYEQYNHNPEPVPSTFLFGFIIAR